MSELETKLREFLSENYRLSDDDLSRDGALFSTGLLDSFAMVELVAFLEKAAGIRVRAKDLTLDNFDTITKITSYIAVQ